VSKARVFPSEQWVDDWVDTSVDEFIEDFKGSTQQRYGTIALWVPQWLFWLRDRNYRIFINKKILIMFNLFWNRPGGDPRGPCERPGARGHHVGDPCYSITDTQAIITV